MIENILAFRLREDFNNRAEIGEIVPFENMQELSAWVGTNTSNIYSVFVYPRLEINELELEELLEEDPFANPDPVTQAYTEIIEVRSYNELPRIMMIDPFGELPDTAPPRVFEEDFLFDTP